MDGRVIETKDAVCSVLSPTFLGIFEGIKAYVNSGKTSREIDLNIFRWDDHFNRLMRSANVSSFEIPYSRNELLSATRETFRANNYRGNTYIQPRIWPKIYSDSEYPEEDVHVLIPLFPFETILDKDNGKFTGKFCLVVSSWRRIASDALPPQNKTFGNYANSRIGDNEANRLGYDGCIFLDSRGFVSEAARACIVFVKDNILITPPVSASILDSITSQTIITLAKEAQLQVEVRDIARVEMYGMDECFLCATGTEIRPVSSIDDLKIGEEYPGPVTRKIAGDYFEVVSGRIFKKSGWLTSIFSER